MLTTSQSSWISAIALGLVIHLTSALPAHAQPRLEEILKDTQKTRLQFSPYTVGSVIAGATNRVYVLNASKDQYLRINVLSTGARAAVIVFDSNGQSLATLNDRSSPFEYQLPRSGDYYIFCYGGPTFHYYDLTVRVD